RRTSRTAVCTTPPISRATAGCSCRCRPSPDKRQGGPTWISAHPFSSGDRAPLGDGGELPRVLLRLSLRALLRLMGSVLVRHELARARAGAAVRGRRRGGRRRTARGRAEHGGSEDPPGEQRAGQHGGHSASSSKLHPSSPPPSFRPVALPVSEQACTSVGRGRQRNLGTAWEVRKEKA